VIILMTGVFRNMHGVTWDLLIACLFGITVGALVPFLGYGPRVVSSLLALCFGGFVSFVFLRTLYKAKRLVSLGALFIFSNVLYYFVSPLASHVLFSSPQLSFNVNLEEIHIDTFWTYVFLVTLALTSFWVGYTLTSKRVYSFRVSSQRSWEVAGWLLAGSGIVLDLLYYSKMGGLGSLPSLAYGDFYLRSRGLGVYKSGHQLLFLAALIFFGVWRTQQKRLSFLVAVVVSAWVVVPELLVGRRGYLFDLLLGLLFILVCTSSKGFHLSLGTVVIGVTAAVFLVAFGRVRAYFSTIGLVGTIRTVSRVVNISWFNPATSEFGAAPSILFRMLMEKTSGGEFWTGSSLVADVLSIIPVVIWASRPETPMTWFARTFFPEYYASGGGYGFSWIAEAYIEGGYVLTAFLALLLGAILSTLDKHARLSFGGMICVAGLSGVVFRIARTDFADPIKRGLVLTVLPLVCAWAIGRIVTGCAEELR